MSHKDRKKNRLIILGAGKPFSGQQHSVLRGATGHRRVLDWLLHAMRTVNPEIHFVGGYQLDAVADRYPELSYSFNPHWETTGAAASLLEVPLDREAIHYVSYADILFRDSSVEALAACESDIALLVDSQWRSRFEGRSSEDIARCEKVNLHNGMVTRLGRDIPPELADAEFVGLVQIKGRAIEHLSGEFDAPECVKTGSLTQLIEYLRVRGFSVVAVDVTGDWAELNEVNDLSRFVLGTKAQTLYRLQGVVTQSRIEEQVSFTVAEWQDNSAKMLDKIHADLAKYRALVIRSSALSEDGFNVSNAGAYTSILNVDREDSEKLYSAIEEVILSYPDRHPGDQVLVQPMLEKVIASGVAFTKSLSSGAPYYVVNYDDTTNSTESITSGASRDHKTLFVRRGTPSHLVHVPDNLKGLLPALKEIEELLDFDSLDIEFAITDGGNIHVLQVRPIAVKHDLDNEDLTTSLLNNAVSRFRQWQSPGPFIVGAYSYYGVMPDWNPAEIIGTRPGRLASSLYRYLILDEIWATQRSQYGYRDVRPQPLLRMFAGHPYIDIRASFNSFVPKSVDEKLAERLVNFYLEWLRLYPHLHDKIEFEVVPTCYALDFERWRDRLIKNGGFDNSDIQQLADGLKSITSGAIYRTVDDLNMVQEIEARLSHFSLEPSGCLDDVFNLLEECKRYGTLVFSHLARSAFIAITLLKSAVHTGVLSQAAVDQFLNSIRTVSHEFTEDVARVARKQLPMSKLVSRYGHLRPGTYDITSPCYASNPAHYLTPAVARAVKRGGDKYDNVSEVKIWESEKPAFAQAMASAGLPSDIEDIENFLRSAIEGRERAKFVFTRYLSLALECLAEFGASYQLSREQIAEIPLESFSALYTGSVVAGNEGKWLEQQSLDGVMANRAALMVELPPLLFTESDFYSFVYTDVHANFVGKQRVLAESIDLKSASNEVVDSLDGKIVLIPQADPGYDWLFGYGIVGLITMYGGANSHMAIRAAEFGLPAAIGVGESRYSILSSASLIQLDPVNKRIEVIG